MAISTIKYTINGTTYDLTYSAAEGAYVASITAPSTTSYNANDDHKYHGQVVATDTAGNSTTVTVNEFDSLGLRVLEKVKPTITVSYPTSNSYITSNEFAVRWIVTDTGSGINVSTITLKVDGETKGGVTTAQVGTGYECSCNLTAVNDGPHTITFDVMDNDGNAATTASVTFTVDTVPPTLTVTEPADGLVTNQAALTISGTTNDASSSPVTLTVKVNTGSAVNVPVGAGGAFSKTINLTEGRNTVTITATDSAGKSSTVVRTVTLNTNAPVISNITITPNPVDTGTLYTIKVYIQDT